MREDGGGLGDVRHRQRRAVGVERHDGDVAVLEQVVEDAGQPPGQAVAALGEQVDAGRRERGHLVGGLRRRERDDPPDEARQRGEPVEAIEQEAAVELGRALGAERGVQP